MAQSSRDPLLSVFYVLLAIVFFVFAMKMMSKEPEYRRNYVLSVEKPFMIRIPFCQELEEGIETLAKTYLITRRQYLLIDCLSEIPLISCHW